MKKANTLVVALIISLSTNVAFSVESNKVITDDSVEGWWIKEDAMEYVVSILNMKPEVINGTAEYWDPGLTIKDSKIIYKAIQMWEDECKPNYQYYLILQRLESGHFEIIDEYTIVEPGQEAC